MFLVHVRLLEIGFAVCLEDRAEPSCLSVGVALEMVGVGQLDFPGGMLLPELCWRERRGRGRACRQ